MQFKLKFESGRKSKFVPAVLSLVTACSLGVNLSTAAEAASKAKSKHPKGFVHDTAGDGQEKLSAASYAKGQTPKWQQYDWGGLYYYQRGEIGKAKQYWLEAYREANMVLPLERRRGLSVKSMEACCELIKHLIFFISDTKFRPGKNINASVSNLQAVNANSNGTMQGHLDDIKEQLRQMDKDWEWYETVCGFANRAIGKQASCMRQIYGQRQDFELKMIITRQDGLRTERALNIPLKESKIDTRPLPWDGVRGAGNPFLAPNSDSRPYWARGGAEFPPGTP